MGGRNVVSNDKDELEKEDERGAPDADAINLNESDDDEDEDNDEEGKMSRRRMGYNEMIAEVEYCGCFQELWSRSKIEGYPKATAVLVHDYKIYVLIDQCKDSVKRSLDRCNKLMHEQLGWIKANRRIHAIHVVHIIALVSLVGFLHLVYFQC